MESRGRTTIFLSSISVFLLLGVFLINSGQWTEDLSSYDIKVDKSFRAPRYNIWSELSEPEVHDVYNFVKGSRPDLNLTKHPQSREDNYIFAVETLRPNKTDAVAYLYEDGEEPDRWAKVTISQHFEDGPYMVFYMVGPLPISRESRVLPLDYVFNSGTNRVKNPVSDYFALIDLIQAFGTSISDITLKLLGGRVDSEDTSDGSKIFAVPRVSSVDTGGMMLWIQFFRPNLRSGAFSLLPQGLYAKIDARSENASHWIVEQLYYNGELYDSADDMREAMDDPDFVQTPRNLDGAWTETEDFDSRPEGRELPPPISIQPYGTRYKLDRREKYVRWFGFEFFITTDATAGLNLFDIRFNGERVIYELGLQEAMAHYAGQDPMQGGLEFMDSFFGMGASMFELVPGYDCPAYADYLDSTWSKAEAFTRVPNSICVFEYTADYLLSRHSQPYSVSASRNTYLVVRAVSTVGNYDYTLDYIFYMDGTIEVKVRASGYIFSAFHTNNSTIEVDEYGHKIHDALSSCMHDHVINFKADLDVAGPQNDMVRMALEPLTRSYPWDKPEVEERNTMHLVETPITQETGLDWSSNSREFYIVYSSDKKNAWGERRGYRITSGTGMGNTIHLTILNSTVLGDAARWAEKDLWVVRRKDTEPRSADPLNWFAPHAPIVNFTAIADNEHLEHGAGSDYDGDLVVYFNLGAHHVPHSGDLPNTLMHTSASSIMFVPYNFADRDPSRASVQGVRLQLNGTGRGPIAQADANNDLRARNGKKPKEETQRARYFGTTYDSDLKLSLGSLEPDLLEKYESYVLDITDLGLNGTAAGVWIRDD